MGLIYTDIPELEGSNTEISLLNLARLDPKFEGMTEKMLAHIDELAYSVVTDGEDFDIIKSILLSIRSDGEIDDSNIINENRGDASLIYAQMSLCQRLILYRLVCERFKEKYSSSLCIKFAKDKKKATQISEDRIAYVKNTYNDEAYIKLSSSIANARAQYFEDIQGVCSALGDGECQYCILPLEASGSKISPFYELVFKNGLEISCICKIKTPDGYTKYALLYSGNIQASAAMNAKAKVRYAELLVPQGEPIGELLLCCEYCGASIGRIDRVNGKTLVTLEIYDFNLEVFLTYLEIECPSIRMLGIYKEIK